MTDDVLWRLLRSANNEGAKGHRITGFTERPISASENPMNGFVFAYDNGPKSATETPWPM